MSEIETPEMLDVVRNLLRTLGYQEPLLVSGYKFGDARATEASSAVSHQIDLAAFAQSPPSVRSACIGVTVSSDESPERIAGFHSLGAPQILAINPSTQRVTRWRMPASGLPVYQDPTPFAQINQLFNLHKTDWSPDTILRAKGIAFSPMPPQPDFIDLGYLPALEEELRIRLNRDLNNILDVCKKTYRQRHSEEVFEAASGFLYRMLFRLIAAKYAIDRGKQPEWEELSASDVVREVEAFFFGSATLEPALDDVPTRDAAWQAVRGGLNLSNLSPEILAHVYENTLVTPSLRKTYGIHATPPAIAEYIVSHLPIGRLNREERRIFEPFCGAAPFLIAGLGRLRTVDTERISPEEQHNYFQQMLVGMEISEFSREIARCSLILADDANRDSWQIFGGNVFTSPEFERHLQWANIVLCNPPHETFAKAEQTKPATAVYENQAAEALHRILERKPSILGLVLPRAFTDGHGFRTLREDIVNAYKDVSVVTLPEKAFEKANQEVALLMAHNLGENGCRYYSGNVSVEEWETFLRTRRPFDEYETSELQRYHDGSPILRYPPLQKLWEYLADYPTLDAYAEMHRGIQYNRPVEECVFDTPQPHTHPGLQTLNGFMEAFIVKKYQHLSIDKTEMLFKAYELDWNSPKVLVNLSPTSSGYWRINGAMDYERLIASQMFYGIWPRSDAPLELLAALISSPIINAYAFAHEGKRHNRLQMLVQAPVPIFTPEQATLIVSLVQGYTAYRLQWFKEVGREDHFREKCLQRLWQIDAAVLEAYALPEDLEHELLRRFEGAKRNTVPFDFPGYGEGYVRAKEALAAEKLVIAAIQSYQELCSKKYNGSLTLTEIEEMQRLGQIIDAHEADTNPLYKLVGIAEGGPPDGAENHDAYIYRS